jgi:hypothetical protein
MPPLPKFHPSVARGEDGWFLPSYLILTIYIGLDLWPPVGVGSYLSPCDLGVDAVRIDSLLALASYTIFLVVARRHHLRVWDRVVLHSPLVKMLCQLAERFSSIGKNVVRRIPKDSVFLRASQ